MEPRALSLPRTSGTAELKGAQHLFRAPTPSQWCPQTELCVGARGPLTSFFSDMSYCRWHWAHTGWGQEHQCPSAQGVSSTEGGLCSCSALLFLAHQPREHPKSSDTKAPAQTKQTLVATTGSWRRMSHSTARAALLQDRSAHSGLLSPHSLCPFWKWKLNSLRVPPHFQTSTLPPGSGDI